MADKIVRSICVFTNDLESNYIETLLEVEELLTAKEYEIQTRRLCTSIRDVVQLENSIDSKVGHISIGKQNYSEIDEILEDFLSTDRISFCLDLANEEISEKHVYVLYKIIERKPQHTFNFSYSFNTPNSSPFFNCTNYEEEGFSIGLQAANLAENMQSIDLFLKTLSEAWEELFGLFGNDKNFLGIDGSVTSLHQGAGSLTNFIKRLGYTFPASTTTDIYTQITEFLKKENPKPIGMNGLMFPALEDFELAEEYSKGEFSIERNIFLSLHSGLGIDTYPIAIDEKPERIVDILKLMQALSNKYSKHFAVRFVSDGKAKIGEMTQFNNQFLKDVVVRVI